MRNLNELILLAVLVAFSAGPVLAQDALNVTNSTNATNVTNVTIVAEVVPVAETAVSQTETLQATEVAPQVAASRFKQLSIYVKGAATILGKNAAQEYADVSQTVNRDRVFTREAGASTPAVKVGITRVNTGEDKYVQVTNQAVGSWDLTGWTLASAENTTFTFPALLWMRRALCAFMRARARVA